MSSTWYKIWMQQSKILLKRWSFTEMGWFLFELINRSKCCWWFQGFDEYSLLMKEVRQVIALYMKDSLQKSISVMKQSLMVLVPNASWISCHTSFTFLWNIIIGCTWQTRKSGIFSTCSCLQTSSITPKLWAVLSVITKSILFT